jgi:hypothetical protein
MNLQIATGALQMMKSAIICSIEKYGHVPPGNEILTCQWCLP